MKKTMFLTVFVMMAAILGAQTRDEVKRRAIASEQLQQAVSEVMLVKQTKGYSLYTSKQSGFVVISQDESCPKVLGYSPSSFNPVNLPDGLKWWLDAVDNRAASNQVAFASSIRPEEEVPNFILTRWGQVIPYNMLCPVDGGKRSLTGCIATALGQTLYLYKYPSKPVGSNIFYINNSGPYYDDFADEYNWTAMKDYYTPNVADESARPVAELLRDCGYATSMNYSATGSEAFCYEQALALTSIFDYPTANVRYAKRSYYSDDEWMYIIYRELAARRPVLYTGLESQEYNADGTMKLRDGHSFLFSGMDTEGRLYVNWGWNGVADGYFDFSDLAPTGIQNNEGTYHFNYDQEMVFGVMPNVSSALMEPKYSDFGTKEPIYSIELGGNALLYITVGFINYYYLPFYGSIDIVFDRADGQSFKMALLDTSSVGVLNTLTGISMTKPVRINGLQAGTYKVYIASKATNDTRHQPLRCHGGPIYFELTKSASGDITMSEAKPLDYHDYTSGIRVPIASSDDYPQVFYTLGGRQITSAQRGINIVRQGGTVKKYIKNK